MDFGSGQFIWKLSDDPDHGYVAASDSRREIWARRGVSEYGNKLFFRKKNQQKTLCKLGRAGFAEHSPGPDKSSAPLFSKSG